MRANNSQPETNARLDAGRFCLGLDRGILGYARRIAEGELPSDAITKSFIGEVVNWPCGGASHPLDSWCVGGDCAARRTSEG